MISLHFAVTVCYATDKEKMWCFNLLADVTVIVMECILNQTVNLPGLAYKKTVYIVAVCVFCSCQVYPITLHSGFTL